MKYIARITIGNKSVICFTIKEYLTLLTSIMNTGILYVVFIKD